MGKANAPRTRRRSAPPSPRRLLFSMSEESSTSSLSSSASASPMADSSDSSELRLGLRGLPVQTLPVGSKQRTTRRKRRNSGDDETVDQEEEASSDKEEREETEAQQEVVTISVSELIKWQERVIFHVEDHFSNEQLKRIAEFGRVHASILQEAQQHVANVEEQMRRQLEIEREQLRVQAEEFAAKIKEENESLHRRVDELASQNDGLQTQVDALEQQVGALQSENIHSGGDNEQKNCENVEEPQTQVHSEPAPQDQEDEEMKDDAENCPTNKGLGEIEGANNKICDAPSVSKPLNAPSGDSVLAKQLTQQDLEEARHPDEPQQPQQQQQSSQAQPKQIENTLTGALPTTESRDVSGGNPSPTGSCETPTSQS